MFSKTSGNEVSEYLSLRFAAFLDAAFFFFFVCLFVCFFRCFPFSSKIVLA